MEGVFSKCQDCSVKPATIKFTNHNIEKKVCYNCQKKLEADPNQREWKKEIIPYSELRRDNRLDQSRSNDYNKVDSSFKSPEPTHNRSLTIQLTESDPLNDSSYKGVGRSTYSNYKRPSVTGTETVSPKVSFAIPDTTEKNTRSFSVTTLTNEPSQNANKVNSWNSTQPINQNLGTTAQQAGAIRHTTPKKKIFFSEYMKDFDPTISTHKSPYRNRDSINKEPRESYNRVSVEDTRPKFISPENNSFREFEVKNDNYNSNKFDQLDKSEKGDSFRSKLNISLTPEKREGSVKAAAGTQEEINKKLKEMRKEEIRAKISKLSEKLYSPSKIIAGENGQKDELINSFESRESKYVRKEASFGVRETFTDTSYFNKPDDLEDFRIPQKTQQSDILNTSNISRIENQNIDTKYKIIIQENENTIFNLKAHIQNLEKRHIEMTNKLKDELRDTKDAVLKDKSDQSSKNSFEIKNLNDRIKDLERNWKDEVSKSKSQQEFFDQTTLQFERKITELRKELDDTKQERDNKISDLNNQIRNNQKSQREQLSKFKAENEQAIARIQEENSQLVKDLTNQLEKKNNEIERIKKEKNELLQYNNDKTSIFQDKIKNLQELNDKLNQTIDLKNEEIKKLNRKVNDAKTEFTIIKNEVDLFDQEKERLKDENFKERLRIKLAKLEKLVYGSNRHKNRSIRLSELAIPHLTGLGPFQILESDRKMEFEHRNNDKSFENPHSVISTHRKSNENTLYGLVTTRSSDVNPSHYKTSSIFLNTKKKNSLYNLEEYVNSTNTPKKPQIILPIKEVDKNLESLETIQFYLRKLDKTKSKENETTKARIYYGRKLINFIGAEEGKYQKQMNKICLEIENGLFCLNEKLKQRVSKYVRDEKLIEFIENSEENHRRRDEINVDQIEQLRKKLETIQNHYERENKNLQKLVDTDNDRHDSLLQSMSELIKKQNMDKTNINEEFDKVKANLIDNKDDPTHSEYVKHIQTLSFSNLEMKEIIRRQEEELENLRNNFHHFIEGYKKMAIKLKYVSEKAQKIKDDIKRPNSNLNEDSSFY